MTDVLVDLVESAAPCSVIPRILMCFQLRDDRPLALEDFVDSLVHATDRTNSVGDRKPFLWPRGLVVRERYLPYQIKSVPHIHRDPIQIDQRFGSEEIVAHE